ncbi:hypothetical protein [Reichenbachiella agariperforans]|uniref:hypothetical protein n=1 Tax=Reichenbachiella agariperforans TaxID=156994 RepID=UPI001C0A0F5E|nr:hypothetical protein [Reichenbachiella agariperforans]MBU2912714.1 hypothetical protein [Reichenbachiella agariperforans]
MDEFLEQLREKAVYFKLTSNSKFGGAVNVDDVIKVLKSLKDSYASFIDAEYSLINVQQDKAKFKSIRQGLQEENNLVIVDLKFESYGMSVTPNTITHSHSIPQIKNQTKWKKESFELYKSIVLESDYNDSEYLKELSRKYNPLQRANIFKPIIDGIVNNEKANTSFRIGNSKKLKKLSTPKSDSVSVLIPVIKKEVEAPIETRTSMAMVEIKGNRAKPKVLELFEEIKNPVYQFNTVEFNGTKYELRFPISCELTHEDEAYVLDNKGLGILSFGKTIDEVQKAFFEEFDYIYSRYNSLPDSDLSSEVIAIKNYLNLIVL